MRYSTMFIPTLKEAPKEAEVISHQLMLRGGFIRKLAAGIYTFLPLGWRCVKKVKKIVREEMDRAGAQEVFLPAVQPSELWIESGRWEFYGPELLRFRDRKGAWFCLGPTHEEVVTNMVRGELRSYRQLPLNLYQIQTKFRDEIRPRAGLMRGREFVMKDGYSFDVDEEAALQSYQVMFDAYTRIFERCGLDFRPVEADTGNIGGSVSHEFQVLADSGEDAIVSCSSCGYTANIEKAELSPAPLPVQPEQVAPHSEIETPDQRTVEEVTRFLGVGPENLVKTLLFLADDKPVAVLIRGDHEANEVKIKAALGCQELQMATDDIVTELTGAPVGFAGPVGLTCPIYADRSVQDMHGFITGANRGDFHLLSVDHPRDFQALAFVDLRLAGAGDTCPRCGGTFDGFRGIEVGQTFYLGTKYSVPMKATYLDAQGQERPAAMGCYGIGVTRILSAAIEQNHDDAGMIWPMSLAPFQVVVFPVQVTDTRQMEVAERLYRELAAQGVDVLLDDRDERPGMRFKDIDLIGIPLLVTVGARGLKEGKVEVRRRKSGDTIFVPLDEVVAEVKKIVGSVADGGVNP